MVKIEATSDTKNEYVVKCPITNHSDWELGYFIRSGTQWMFKPLGAMIFGPMLLQDIAWQLAELNKTTLQ